MKQITVIRSTTSKAPKGYPIVELAYKSDDGKTKGMKVLGFGPQKAIADVLSGRETGTVLDVEFEQNDRGYWQFKSVQPTGKKEEVATQEAPKGKSGSNWEGPAWYLALSRDCLGGIVRPDRCHKRRGIHKPSLGDRPFAPLSQQRLDGGRRAWDADINADGIGGLFVLEASELGDGSMPEHGWRATLDAYRDVSELQRQLKAPGVAFQSEADERGNPESPGFTGSDREIRCSGECQRWDCHVIRVGEPTANYEDEAGCAARQAERFSVAVWSAIRVERPDYPAGLSIGWFFHGFVLLSDGDVSHDHALRHS